MDQSHARERESTLDYGTPGDGQAELRVKALERLKAKRGLQAHALAYVLVNGFLVAIWAVSGAGFFWPMFPLFGWGIGLAFNAWDVLSPEPSQAKIASEMERLKRRA